MLDDLIRVIGAAATVVSVGLGIGQVTATSRLRKQSAFWREAAEVEPSSQRAILYSLHRDALARLVSRQAISLWGLLLPSILLLACVLSYFDLGRAVARFRADGSWIGLSSVTPSSGTWSR